MIKTIRLSEDTHTRLNKLGRRGETYEDIIVRLLDKFEENTKSDKDTIV